jgi:hypothetical protein
MILFWIRAVRKRSPKERPRGREYVFLADLLMVMAIRGSKRMKMLAMSRLLLNTSKISFFMDRRLGNYELVNSLT